MIIVSEEEDDSDSKRFLRMPVYDSVLNISHDYRYLHMGYYVSAHAETFGVDVTPTCAEILDAYRNPLLMAKCKRSGLPSDGFRFLTFGRNVRLPALLFAVNPFTYNSMKIVDSESKLFNAIESMSFGSRFPVAVHPLVGDVEEAVQVFGLTDKEEALPLTKRFFDIFKIPICRLIFQVDRENNLFLSHCEPAQRREVNWSLVHEKVAEITEGSMVKA